MNKDIGIFVICYLAVTIIICFLRAVFLSVAIDKGYEAKHYFASKKPVTKTKKDNPIFDESINLFFYILFAFAIIPYKSLEFGFSKIIDGLMNKGKEKKKEPMEDILDS